MTIVLKWIVIEWSKLWRQIGFRTANILCNSEQIQEWTYKINVKFNRKKYSWVWSYLKHKWVFESHIFDIDKDIYWKKIEVYMLKKIRDNKKFDNLDDLKSQIEKDIEITESTKIKVMTFWTFDKFHPGHKSFLKQASFYWDELITLVATDNNVSKIKWKIPKDDEQKRMENVIDSKLSNIVLIWSDTNPLLCLDTYKPDIICLWYDQMWFINLLKNSEYSNIEIIRLKPYKSKIYKSSLMN